MFCSGFASKTEPQKRLRPGTERIRPLRFGRTPFGRESRRASFGRNNRILCGFERPLAGRRCEGLWGSLRAALQPDSADPTDRQRAVAPVVRSVLQEVLRSGLQRFELTRLGQHLGFGGFVFAFEDGSQRCSVLLCADKGEGGETQAQQPEESPMN